MSRIALFPGSFDPITRGHESIIRRGLTLFDKIIVAVGVNAEKKSFFSVEQRLAWIRECFKDEPRVEVDIYRGLTVSYCQEQRIYHILRGLRTSADFEFERSIGQINKQMMPDLETVFLLTTPEYTALNSSIVRDILRHGGDVSAFVPPGIRVLPPDDRLK